MWRGAGGRRKEGKDSSEDPNEENCVERNGAFSAVFIVNYGFLVGNLHDSTSSVLLTPVVLQSDFVMTAICLYKVSHIGVRVHERHTLPSAILIGTWVTIVKQLLLYGICLTAVSLTSRVKDHLFFQAAEWVPRRVAWKEHLSSW